MQDILSNKQSPPSPEILYRIPHPAPMDTSGPIMHPSPILAVGSTSTFLTKEGPDARRCLRLMFMESRCRVRPEGGEGKVSKVREFTHAYFQHSHHPLYRSFLLLTTASLILSTASLILTLEVVLGLPHVHPVALECERVQTVVRRDVREDFTLDRCGPQLNSFQDFRAERAQRGQQEH